ncbi:MAG: MFS transporter [Magnetococcales bacterium]|nr:MFS transporter [Magnetococcales bacterium]
MTTHLKSLYILTLFIATALGYSFPLLDLALNRMGASGLMLGLNAAMPALGWLLLTPLLPTLQRRFGNTPLLFVFIATAASAMVGFHLFPDIRVWMLLRFLFGGSIGLAFRVIEFLINVTSPPERRGRNIGIYTTIFCASLMLGAMVVPIIGTTGWTAYLFVSAVLTMGGLFLLLPFVSFPDVLADTAAPTPAVRRFVGLLPIAVISAFAWGVYESVHSALMPVYAVRVGLSESWAALTVAAYSLGGLLFPIPLGMLADRMNRQRLVVYCAALGGLFTLAIPLTEFQPELFLFVLMIWVGITSGLYTVALSAIGERFTDVHQLAGANAAFGTLYAAGGLIGPLIHGAAMDAWNPHGVLASAAITLVLFSAFGMWKLHGMGKH